MPLRLHAENHAAIRHHGLRRRHVPGLYQSLSRSYFTKIIPPENSGEYFGIYDIFSKGASFIGSAVIAAVKFAGGTINIAVGLMAIFFFLGFVLLRVADRKESARV